VQIEPTPDPADVQDRRLFDYLHRETNIVLLGESGDGKTHSLREVARLEGYPLCSVRDFMAGNANRKSRFQPLDALDEYRPRAATCNQNAFTDLIRTLRENGSPFLRLSCRSADWLGSSDLELLKSYCDSTGYVVLSLKPLSWEDAAEVLTGRFAFDVQAFLRHARDHDLEALISNPQTLLMLAGVVEKGGWPISKSELFDRACLNLLSEHSQVLQTLELGQYAPQELMDAIGAVFAMMLITDASGVSLSGDQGEDCPSYRRVPHARPEEVLAALKRRACSVSPGGLARYLHRMTAEYFGAMWIAKKIEQGLPVGRVQGLLGVDGRPSRELRGLHAWLPIFLPKFASHFIEADPYGVLVYGDAGSLRGSAKGMLLRSLEKAVSDDPLLFANTIPPRSIGSLLAPESVGYFVELLSRPEAPAGLRRMALSIVAEGKPFPQLFQPLTDILRDGRAPLINRELAFESLLNYGQEGAAAVVDSYRLLGEGMPFRVRTVIVTGLYGNPFGPADAAHILLAARTSNDSHAGDLWQLDRKVPVAELMRVLQEYEQRLDSAGPAHTTLNFAAQPCVHRMIARVCKDASHINPGDLFQVLMGLDEKDRGQDTRGEIREAILGRPRLRDQLIDAAIERFTEFKDPRALAFDVYHATQRAAHVGFTAERLMEHLEGTTAAEDATAKYEAVGYCLNALGAGETRLLDRFIELGDSRPEFQSILEHYRFCPYEDWRREEYASTVEWARQRAAIRQEYQTLITANARSIGDADDPGLLGWLAQLYWGWFAAWEFNNYRRKQMVDVVGPELTEVVERGFRLAVERQAVPTVAEIAQLNSLNQIHFVWYALLAGMDLRWADKRSFDGLSEATIASLFAISLLVSTGDDEGNPSSGDDREWAREILVSFPHLARSVYEEMIKALAQSGRSGQTLILKLSNRAETAAWRGTFALQILRDHDISDPADLQPLCLLAYEMRGQRSDLSNLAEARGHAAASEAAQTFWIAVCFVFERDRFEEKLREITPSRRDVLWTIHSLANPLPDPRTDDRRIPLNVQQIEHLVRLFGELFEDTNTRIDPWGARGGFEAALYVRDLISALGTRSDVSAGAALNRLLNDERLNSYRWWIQHCLAEQYELNRRSRYKPADWATAAAVLSGGAPANTADLYALTLDYLSEIAHEIRNRNTDPIRVFWLDEHRPAYEEPSRDRLIDILRPRFERVGVSVEPEGHMARDKRADIILQRPGKAKLPIEVKRESHPELWTSAENQLQKLYTRDPASDGYGIYLVLFFGVAGLRTPDGKVITSAAELRSALTETLPADQRSRITCIVLDVSLEPNTPRSRNSTKKRSRRQKPALATQ
jgi:hypothetical protein